MSITPSRSGRAVSPSSATAGKWTGRERFRNACRCRSVDRPPVWLMRQAGRVLPEYRRLKEKHTFLDLVQNPELAAEVTLQPIRRFAFDAAILFSDILVVPEAMGQAYRFRETGGVVLDFAVRTRADIERLSVERVSERLGYVERALQLLRRELGRTTALIGFAGSPWTLATFMLEGGSAAKYHRALNLFREDRKTFYTLAEKLTAAVAAYLRMQAGTGVDALQIFDSHGGLLAPVEFQEASGRWMKDVVATLRSRISTLSAAGGKDADLARRGKVGGVGARKGKASSGLKSDSPQVSPPVIVFSLGTHGNWDDLLGTGANVLGIDWRFSLVDARELLPGGIGLQGNLAPALLSEATPKQVVRETGRLLEEMRDRPGYIFNLGHGVPPAAKLENIAALVETVRSFK